MDHPLQTPAPLRLGTWRSAAVLAAAVAAVELVLLVAAGVALLTRGSAAAPRPARAAKAHQPVAHPARHATTAHVKTAAAALPRTKVGVVVLNGNGRHGAAAAAAARVHRRGYRIRGVGNAARMSYAHSLVMYRPGYAGEGRRLARDLGVRLVGPIDGMRPAQLHGAQIVLILGG